MGYLRLFTFGFALCFGFLSFAIPVSAKKGRLTGYARVIDGDTIAIKGEKIRLHGIDAPEKSQKCVGDHGKSWACGKISRKRLVSMIGGRDISCNLHKKDGFGRWIGTCFSNNENLNKKMVRQGMAWAFRKYSMDFVAEEKKAKIQRVGIWRGKSLPAWLYRKKKWQRTVKYQTAPGNCKIKGNISRRNRRVQKIYHLPGFRSYGKTRINQKKGERWFCSEREAMNAGWRKAKVH